MKRPRPSSTASVDERLGFSAYEIYQQRVARLDPLTGVIPDMPTWPFLDADTKAKWIRRGRALAGLT